ncbi:MAG: glycoside hydrolase family 71/99-like protein [Armatimonadetes bacterium]|nr:glycoside hydrolase family 71/99-like protein [Armatimonadota bacterium]
MVPLIVVAVPLAALLAVQAAPTREQVIDTAMKPYTGPSTRGVDRSTLTGKVMCGYQGWFTAPGDGAGRGWFHWGRGDMRPGSVTVDLWPDLSELDPDERVDTAFRHADGRVAQVFSSFNRKTVLRHMRWMRDYGIDGSFVQRFAGETMHPAGLRQSTTVLGYCREGSNLYGRTYAVMYDLSGLGAGQMERVKEDWRLLFERMQITKDPAYLRHKGKPVVAVWGVGFNDNRKYTLAECRSLVEFLKNDPRVGGCTVMLGVPTYWRTLNRDSLADPALHEVIALADIVSPWMVGRYGTVEDAVRIGREVFAPDLQWCRGKGLDYLPVVFPGFSWHNMIPSSKQDQIPRRGGKFLWAQYVAAKKAGATMVYQAMFDEVDEGTAIFKCTNDPPVGESTFVTYEGLPSDHYLWLVGQAARMVRGAAPVREEMPKR